MEENNDFLNLTEEDQLNSNDGQNNASPEEENKKNTENQGENNSNQENPPNLTETISSTTQALTGTTDNQNTEDEQPQNEIKNEPENLSQINESITNAADAMVESMTNKTEDLENKEEPTNTDNDQQEPARAEEQDQENTENISEVKEAFNNAVDTMANSLNQQPESTEKELEKTENQENDQTDNLTEPTGPTEPLTSAIDAMKDALIPNTENQENDQTENPTEPTEPAGSTEQTESTEPTEPLSSAIDAMKDALIPNTENQENDQTENPAEPKEQTEPTEPLTNAIDAMKDALIPNTENQENQENTENPENQDNPDNQDNPEDDQNPDNQSNTSEEQTDETAKEYVYDSGVITLYTDPTPIHDRFLFNHVTSISIFPSEAEPTQCLFSATTDTRVFENYCKYLKLSDVTTFHFTSRNNDNEGGFDTFFTFCTGKELTTLINPTEEQISVAMKSFKQSFVVPCSLDDLNKLESYEKVEKNERFASKSMIEYLSDQISQQKVTQKTDLFEYENPSTFSSFINVSIDSFLGHFLAISGDECERVAKNDHEYTHDNQSLSIFDNDFDFHSLLGINNFREIELSPNNFVHCAFSSTEDSVLEKFLSLTQIGKVVSFHFSTSPNGHVNYFTLCTGKTLITIVNPPQSQMNVVFDKVKKSYLIPCGLNDKTQLFFYDYMNKIQRIPSDYEVAQIVEEIKAVQESVYMKKWKYDIASSYEKFLNVSYTAFIGYLVRSTYLDPIVQPSEFRSFDVHDFISLRRLDYGKKVALNWQEGKVYILKQYKDLYKFNQAIYLYKNNKMSQIIPFYGEAINDENYLVFGLASRGTMKEVAMKEYVDISTSRKITIQLVFLLAYLHMTDTKPCNISADNISIDWDYNAYLSDLDGSEKVINCTPEQLDVKNLGNALFTLVTGRSPSSSFSRGIPSIYESVSHIFELTRKTEITACDLVSDILSNKLFSKEEKLIDFLLSQLPNEFETLEAFEDSSFKYFKFNCREINEDQINFIKTMKFGQTATIQFISEEDNLNDDRIFIFETNKICGTLKNASPKVVNLVASKMKNSTVAAVSDKDLDIFFEYYNFDLIQKFIREPQLSVFRKNAADAAKEMNEFDDRFIVGETLALSYVISNPTKYRVLMEEPAYVAPRFPDFSLLNQENNLKNVMPTNQVRLVEVYDNFNLLCLYSTEEDYTFNEFMRDFNKDKFVVVHFSNEFVSFIANKKLILLETNDNINQVNKVISLIKETKVYGVCPVDRSRLFSFTNFDLIQSFATQKEMDELCSKVEKNRDNLFPQNFTFDKPPMTYSTYFNHAKCGIAAYYLLLNPEFEENSQSLSKMVEQSIEKVIDINDNDNSILLQTPTQTFVDFDTEEDLKKAFNLYTLAAERNDPSAFFNLGLMYSIGQGVEKDKEKAAEYYKKAADLGNPKAQFNLGLMHYKGEAVEEDKTEAARLYQLAADQGVAKAQTNLGLMYSKGDGVEQNYEKAVQLYEQAVAQNDPDAQLNLGMMIDQGQGTPVDKERVVDLYTKSAENGNAKAQFNLGVMYHNGEKGVLQKDNKKAVKYYSMAASQGLPKAQFNLGVLYSKGDDDIPVDKKLAAQLFQLAADQNDSDAQLNLGAMYAKGEGVPNIDKEKTAELYKKAAKQGNPKAQFNLAVMYSKGDGVEKNFKKAAKYYQKASDQDISQASFNLGVIYFRGQEGVEEDKTKAAELFEKTANLNPKNSKALFNLAIMYMKGEGVEKDEEKALYYFEKAAELNNKDALLNLGMIYIEGGCGVEPNKKKAFSYYQQAALLGNDKAQLNYGIMLQNGEGCEKDIEKAKEFFQLAADQGNAQAQINLGLLLIGRDDEIKEAQKKQLEETAEKGNSESMYDLACKYQEEDDIENAIKWFTRAASKDNSKAQLELGKIYLYGNQTEVDLDKSELFLQSAAKNNEPDASVHLDHLNEEREKSIALEQEKRREEEERQRKLRQEEEEEAERQRKLRQEEEEEAERQRKLKQEEEEEAERQRKLKQEEEEEAERQRKLKQEEEEEAERQRKLKQEEEEEAERQRKLKEQQENEIETIQNNEEEPKQEEQNQEEEEPKQEEQTIEDEQNQEEEPEVPKVVKERKVVIIEPQHEEQNEDEEETKTNTTGTYSTEERSQTSFEEEEEESENNCKLTLGGEEEESAEQAKLKLDTQSGNELQSHDQPEEEESAEPAKLQLDVTSDNETPPHEQEEETKMKEVATLAIDDEDEEEEEDEYSADDNSISTLMNSLEERIKPLNKISTAPFSDALTTLENFDNIFVYARLSKQVSDYNKATNSLKSNVEEAEKIVNENSSNLPSLKKNNSSENLIVEQQNSDSEDEELRRIKSEVSKLESLIDQTDQQIKNLQTNKQRSSNQNNSTRPSALIREPDAPRRLRPKAVNIQSPRSARTKIKNLEKKANQGDPAAQYSLGACYSIGQGVEKDKEKGFEFYLKSAEQGYTDGQFAVASCYTYGRGTKINRQKAFDYYLKAAKQGHDKSQFAVGHFYDCGYGGVQQDHEKAVEWYKLAAEQGHQGAIEQLKSESDESPLLSVDKVSDE